MDLKLYGIIGAIILLLSGGGYFANSYFNPSSATVKARALKFSASCNNSCEEDHAGNYNERIKCRTKCDNKLCDKYPKKLQFCKEREVYLLKRICKEECNNGWTKMVSFSKERMAAYSEYEKCVQNKCLEPICHAYPTKSCNHLRNIYPGWEGSPVEIIEEFGIKKGRSW